MNGADADVARARARAVLALLVACSLWGFGFVLVKAFTTATIDGGPRLGSWFVASFMVGARFGAAALVVGAFERSPPGRGEWLQGLGLGASTGAGMVLQTDGLAYTNASTGAFLTQGYVVFLPLVGALWTLCWPPVRITVSALLVLAGLALLSHFDVHALRLGRGEAETLAAAACFTVQILVLDAKRFRGNRTGPVSFVMFLSMALVAFPVSIVTARSGADVSSILRAPGSLWLLSAMTLLPTLASFLLMNRFQPHVTASEAGIVYATEPVVASLCALVFPAVLSGLLDIDYENESLDPRLIAGGALVLVANLLLARTAPSTFPQ
jgi:drug/metabolite transporter (DMT)-like permease